MGPGDESPTPLHFTMNRECLLYVFECYNSSLTCVNNTEFRKIRKQESLNLVLSSSSAIARMSPPQFFFSKLAMNMMKDV